jgi:hydroxymethylglutaryl-CoA lyase
MQGMIRFVPTEQKVQYINALLEVGYDTIDIGSFVSPKAIPQMSDSLEVIRQVTWSKKKPEFLVIVANERGGETAVAEEKVDVIGFPLSISETFQQRNTGSSINEAFHRLENIQKLADSHQKKLVIYLSMGFGNPYEEEYSPAILSQFSKQIKQHLQPQCIALSDTIGSATPALITDVFQTLNGDFSDLTFSAHLHTTPNTAEEKIIAAWNSGCRRFDSAIGGWGGCPMAKDDLTGNMPSEAILTTLASRISNEINMEAFEHSKQIAHTIFT